MNLSIEYSVWSYAHQLIRALCALINGPLEERAQWVGQICLLAGKMMESFREEGHREDTPHN